MGPVCIVATFFTFCILSPACIGLFVVYQAWFKPTYLPTPPSDQPNTVVEDSQERAAKTAS